MNVASEQGRNAVAELLGWLFGGLFGWLVDLLALIFGNLTVTGWVLGGLAALFVLWRMSLAFGPLKKCWRCGGDGHVGGLFGGRKRCTRCDGGLRPRAGSGGE